MREEHFSKDSKWSRGQFKVLTPKALSFLLGYFLEMICSEFVFVIRNFTKASKMDDTMGYLPFFFFGLLSITLLLDAHPMRGLVRMWRFLRGLVALRCCISQHYLETRIIYI